MSKVIELDRDLARRLSNLAREVRSSESALVEDALEIFFAEYEDTYVAQKCLVNSKTKINSRKEVRKSLDD